MIVRESWRSRLIKVSLFQLPNAMWIAGCIFRTIQTSGWANKAEANLSCETKAKGSPNHRCPNMLQNGSRLPERSGFVNLVQIYFVAATRCPVITRPAYRGNLKRSLKKSGRGNRIPEEKK